MTGMRWRRALTVSASGLALALVATPAMAQTASAGQNATEAELLRLMKQQAAKIDQLEDRIARLEAEKNTQSASAAPAPTTTPQTPRTSRQAAIDASVQNAIEDSSSGEIAQMQAQLAQLARSNKRGVDVRWRNGGPEFRSADGFFTFRPTGRAMFDFSTTTGSQFDERNVTGSEARDLRLGARGTIGDLGYKVDVGFEGGSVSLKEAYISYDTKLIGRSTEFYLGQKLEDRSIEGSTTKRRIPFMERNAVANMTAPEVGFFAFGPQVKVVGTNWHASVAFSGDDIGSDNGVNASYAVLGRAHWNPIKGRDGFVHVGAWGWFEDLSSEVDSINEHPRVAQHFNDNLEVSGTSITGTTRDNAYGFELGGVFKSFYGFGEYGDRYIHATDDPSAHQRGYSIYGGWLITGEKPGFSTRSGIWGTTHVNDPVTSGGIGAFELAARYDDFDYSDEPDGGRANTITVGLNWYLNDWARLMVNYVHWKTDNHVGSEKGEDTGDSIGARAQVSF